MKGLTEKEQEQVQELFQKATRNDLDVLMDWLAQEIRSSEKSIEEGFEVRQ